MVPTGAMFLADAMVPHKRRACTDVDGVQNNNNKNNNTLESEEGELEDE